MNIIDITKPLWYGMPVWPGDQPFEPSWTSEIRHGAALNVGAVTMSLHTGTHADAPLHVREGGEGIGAMPLEAYIGPAVVVEVSSAGAIGPEVIEHIDPRDTPRVLFKTVVAPEEDRWRDDFAYLSAALCDTLVDRNFRLVGIDTPSVDQAQSKDLICHHKLYSGNIVNIENLNLINVSAGRYTLISFPLPLGGMDASPVRAVLVTGLQEL